jgi:hypothetical protein
MHKGARFRIVRWHNGDLSYTNSHGPADLFEVVDFCLPVVAVRFINGHHGHTGTILRLDKIVVETEKYGRWVETEFDHPTKNLTEVPIDLIQTGDPVFFMDDQKSSGEPYIVHGFDEKGIYLHNTANITAEEVEEINELRRPRFGFAYPMSTRFGMAPPDFVRSCFEYSSGRSVRDFVRLFEGEDIPSLDDNPKPKAVIERWTPEEVDDYASILTGMDIYDILFPEFGEGSRSVTININVELASNEQEQKEEASSSR